MGKEKYLCPCFKVTQEDILEAIANGADSFKAVKKETKVSKKCGHCECKVKEFTKEHLKIAKNKDKDIIKEKSKDKDKSKHKDKIKDKLKPKDKVKTKDKK